MDKSSPYQEQPGNHPATQEETYTLQLTRRELVEMELACASASYDDADTDAAAAKSQAALDSAEFKVALLLNRPWALAKKDE